MNQEGRPLRRMMRMVVHLPRVFKIAPAYSRILLIALAVVAVAGCGQTDEDALRDSVATYFSGFASGDANIPCGYMTAHAKGELLSSVRQAGIDTNCQTALSATIDQLGDSQRSTFGHARIESLQLQGDSAVVTIDGSDAQSRWVKTASGWKVNDLGTADSQ